MRMLDLLLFPIPSMIKIVKKIGFFLFSNKSVEGELPFSSNLVKGKNCIIEPTASLNYSREGMIVLEGGNYIGKFVEIGPIQKISIGTNTSIQDRCILLGDITIGRHCLFASNVYVSSGRHYFDLKPEWYIKDQDALVAASPELKKKHSKKVVIEDDCWLGANVVVMSGIKIGKGSVIGANSVVTKDVAPYSIMAGSPAKLVKTRLDFKAKSELLFSNDTDLPYFYSGFLCGQSDLTEYRPKGGIRVLNTFSLILAVEGKKNITVSLGVLSSQAIKITYNNQSHSITRGNFNSITFELAKGELHEFRLSDETNVQSFLDHHCVLLKSVITE